MYAITILWLSFFSSVQQTESPLSHDDSEMEQTESETAKNYAAALVGL